MIFEARYSESRLIGLIILAAGAIILGSYVAVREEASFIRHMSGVACVLLALMAIATLIRSLSYFGPVVRVDQQGVFWHRWSDRTIPWSNIVEIQPYMISRQRMIRCVLRDPLLNPPKALSGFTMHFNKFFGFGHFSLTLSGTDGDYDTLVKTILHYRVALG